MFTPVLFDTLLWNNDSISIIFSSKYNYMCKYPWKQCVYAYALEIFFQINNYLIQRSLLLSPIRDLSIATFHFILFIICHVVLIMYVKGCCYIANPARNVMFRYNRWFIPDLQINMIIKYIIGLRKEIILCFRFK